MGDLEYGPPMFEKDPNQDGVPDGHVAYILRYWGVVYETGVVTKVQVTNGLPHLTWISGGEPRLAKFPEEVTRVFVTANARIDPEVFRILAKPKPQSTPQSLREVFGGN